MKKVLNWVGIFCLPFLATQLVKLLAFTLLSVFSFIFWENITEELRNLAIVSTMCIRVSLLAGTALVILAANENL